MKLNTFYRISDGSYSKPKLPGLEKLDCLKNYTNCFDSTLTIIADNCNRNTIKNLNNFNIVETNLGNAGSFIYSVELACKLNDNDFVYIVEDDYLHMEDEKTQIVLEEGLKLADYVSLFDHPDKYSALYDYGETTKVVKSLSSNWKHTCSTTMTFATTAGQLKKDINIWKKYTAENHPQDHLAFLDLKNQNRTLISSIPGRAFHTDLTEYLRWNLPVDAWAVNLAELYLRNNLGSIEFDCKQAFDNEHGINRLFYLAAYLSKKKQTSI